MPGQIDEVKSRLDIIDVIGGYVRLQKAGRNYKANCPFHLEKTPSFMVSPERQIWRCFGCGKGGSIFDFVMEMERVEFGDALKILAQRAGVELKKIDPKLKTERTRLYEICDLANRFFIKQLELSRPGKKVQNYLLSRGLKPETVKEWGIGYAPGQWSSLLDFLGKKGYPRGEAIRAGLAVKNERGKYYDRFRDRITFPIFDINGITVGFTGRENPDNPDKRMGKYINIPNTLIYDKSKILYGLNKAKLDIRKKDSCVLVEGQMDVLMAHQSGFRNVIASSGTALTEYQLKIIKRYTENLATAFDMDWAGEEATKRGINLAIELGLNTKIISLPESKDPADCLLKDVALWKKSVNSASGIIEFYLTNALAKNNPETVEGKKQISQAVLPAIKRISNRIEQSHWLQETAKRISVKEEDLREEMAKIKFSPSNLRQEDGNNSDNLCENKIDLEEYTLGLILSCAENPKECQVEPSDFFVKNELGQIWEAIKKIKAKKINLEKLKKNLTADLAGQIDHLILKAEAQKNIIEEFEPKKEIRFCFSQLKKRHLRNRLNRLGLAIQQAESKKDKFSLKNLTEEFNELTKQIL